MNQWRKQFQEHTLQKELDTINSLLDSASLETTDETIIDSFNRLVVVLRTFTAFVKSLNPECTVMGYLDQLNAPLSQLRPQLEQFLKTETPNYLKGANIQADQLVQKMPSFALPEAAKQHADSINSLTVAVEGLISSLTQQSKSTSNDLKNLSTEVQSTSTRLENLDKTIELQKARLDTSIADFQKQFSDTQEARRKEIEQTETYFKAQFEQFKDGINSEIDELQNAQKTTLETLTQNLNATADQIILDMENKKDSAAKVLDVSTNVAVTGSYGKYASHEKIAADILRLVALVLMGGLVFGAYKTIQLAMSVDIIDWKILSLRTVTTLTLVFPAFYAVRESNKHRATEQCYRKMQLELAAIDPYLELLDKDKRERIKETLSTRFFAQPEINNIAADVDAGSLLDILKQVITTLLKK